MGEGTDMEKMLRAVGCVITLLATVVVIACEDGSSSSVSPASPSSLPFALSSQNASGRLPFELNGDDRRVTLCHVTGNGSYQLLEVDENAREAHEGHGDGYPHGEEVPEGSELVAGEVPGEFPLMFDEQCGILRPGVNIEKATNTEDADEAPGPEIPIGDVVVWTYVVTNTGDYDLTNFVITDDQEGSICESMDELEAESMMTITCAADGLAELGPYDNLGEVTADFTTGLGTGDVSDSDPSHYLGFDPDAEPEEDEGPKVDLCHKTGNNGRYILINVSRSAEPAHLAHGDGYPGGPVPPPGSGTFSSTCSVL